MADAAPEDLYAVLNIPRTVRARYATACVPNHAQASHEEIKVAYRKLARLYHPDKHTNPEHREVSSHACIA